MDDGALRPELLPERLPPLERGQCVLLAAAAGEESGGHAVGMVAGGSRVVAFTYGLGGVLLHCLWDLAEVLSGWEAGGVRVCLGEGVEFARR